MGISIAGVCSLRGRVGRNISNESYQLRVPTLPQNYKKESDTRYMKTKPFNLEEALKGAPVVTRKGDPVTQLTMFKNVGKSDRSLVGVINGHLDTFTHSGDYIATDHNSGSDLFMVAAEKTVYVNLYKRGDSYTSYAYSTEKRANDLADSDRIGGKAFPLTYEE